MATKPTKLIKPVLPTTAHNRFAVATLPMAAQKSYQHPKGCVEKEPVGDFSCYHCFDCFVMKKAYFCTSN